MAAIFAVFEVYEPTGGSPPETAEPVFVEGEHAARAILSAIEGASMYGYAVRVALDGMTPLPRCDPDRVADRAAMWSANAPRWAHVPLDPSKGYDAFGEPLRAALEPVITDARVSDVHVALQFTSGGPIVHEFDVQRCTGYDALGEAARDELECRLTGPWQRWAPLTAHVCLRPVRAC